MPANRFELLAAWYLRFNGYLTVPDFVVHKDYRKCSGGTDADILAVRFPHSREEQVRFDLDRDRNLVRCNGEVDFVIAEVKSGMCDLNKPWRNAERKNVEYVIRWFGFEGDDQTISEIAGEVYESGAWQSSERNYVARFLMFGAEPNSELQTCMPGVAQITHTTVIDFLQRRFRTGCYGVNRQNWEPDIVEFAERCKDEDIKALMCWARRAV